MICSDCSALIQKADHAFHNPCPSVSRQEVSTSDFLNAVNGQCYLCTRLHIELGEKKWNQLFSHLSQANLVCFDKSAHCHVPNNILVRLGCKLTPFCLDADTGEQVLGKSYSYGYLQVALLPRDISSLALPTPAIASKHASSTSAEAIFSLLAYWLHTFNTAPEHDLCRQQLDSPKVYPTRLMDLAPEGLSKDSWKLVEVQHDSLSGPFMTLSHRWGAGAIKLKRDNHHQLMGGLPYSVLPITYQDAIKVVRYLNVRYLWIDSICIFQDERTDVQKEATRMAEVYGNAICNISALSGKDDGLFCARSPELVNSDSVFLDKSVHHLRNSYIINDLQLWRGELVHMPLMTRGWVLQEEVLAPRTIYFGSRQVLWNCLSFRACETYPAMQRKQPLKGETISSAKGTFLHDEEIEPITSWLTLTRGIFERKSLDETRQDREALYKVWTDLVGHYSLRQLTFPTDKLLAIAGVSKLFGSIMQDEFVAGLWRQHLMEGLLWYIRVNTLTTAPVKYRAPSWSWASKDGYVIYAEPFNASWTVARAVEVDYHVEDEDPLAPRQQFGLITSASMRLQAPAIRIRKGGGGEEWSGFTGKCQVPRLTVRVDTLATLPAEEDFIGAIIRTTSYRLTDGSSTAGTKILLAAQGIVLHQLSSNSGMSDLLDGSAHLYRRVGYFALEDRKSGSLTPRWAPKANESVIFPPPLTQDQMGEFSFENVGTGSSTLTIV